MKTILENIIKQVKTIRKSQIKLNLSIYDYDSYSWSLKNEYVEIAKICDINDLGDFILMLIDSNFEKIADDFLYIYVLRLLGADKDFIEIFENKFFEKQSLIKWCESVFGSNCFYTDFENELCEYKVITTEELKTMLYKLIQTEIKQ